jgi:hypothetical protein
MKKYPSAFFAAQLSIMLLAAVLFTSKMSAQKYDTLHLYYNNISVQPHDTTLKKMDRWIASLKGKHQDIKIIAYYHKMEFKKYSQERVDEMFLIINRKARPLFTITEMKPAKGKDYQRTTVDIIYTPTGGSADAAASTPKKEEAPEKKKEGTEKTEKEKEVASKDAGKPEKKEEKKDKKSEKKDKGAGGGVVGAGAAGAGAATKATKASEPEEEEPSNNAAAESVNKSIGVVLMDNEMAKPRVGKKGDPQAFSDAYNNGIKKAFQREWNPAKLNFVSPADKSGDIVLSPSRESKGELMSFIGREGTFEKPFRVSMLGTTPQVADFLVLAHKVKIFYGMKQEFDREKLTKTLENKTLYVSADQCDLDQAKFKAAYPYPFSIVSKDELLEQANGRKKGALYMRGDDYEGTANVLLIDAETGAIIARAPGSLKAKASTLKDLSNQQKQTTEIYPLTIY